MKWSKTRALRVGVRESWVGVRVQKSRATAVNSGARGDGWASGRDSLTRVRVEWLWSEG